MSGWQIMCSGSNLTAVGMAPIKARLDETRNPLGPEYVVDCPFCDRVLKAARSPAGHHTMIPRHKDVRGKK
jgi:hypothetical protein